MTYRVYSPDNEPFDIASKDRADDLVLNKGWTKQPQVQAEAPAVEDVPELPVTPRLGSVEGKLRGRGRGRGKPAVETPLVDTDDTLLVADARWHPPADDSAED